MNKIWSIFEEEEKEKKKSSVWDVFDIELTEPTKSVIEPTQFGVGAKAEDKPMEDFSTPMGKIQYYKSKIDHLESTLKEKDTFDWGGSYDAYRYAVEQYNEAVKEYNIKSTSKWKQTFKEPQLEPDIPSEPKSFWDISKDPKLMELHKINFESFRLWFKELKESPDKIAFLKGEGQSEKLKGLRKQYNELAPYMYKKSEQWIENVSMIAIGVGMVGQLANALVTSGFKVRDKVFSAKEIKDVLGRARAAYDFETGKFKATLSNNDYTVIKQINAFLKTTKKSPAARKMLEKVVEKTGGLSFPQQVNIFGTKLHAGIPIDEMVKSIVSAGKLTQDIVNQLKVMNPVDTGLVFQQLSMASPAIASKVASEFVDLIPQKITKIPKAEEEMTPEETEQFEKLKEAKIISEKEIEPTKVELEEIEKIPITKEKFMAKMEERVDKKTQAPIEEIEPTPEEIKLVFMEEGNLETTIENRELFYEKYNKVYTETKKGYEKLIADKFADLKEEGFKGVDKGGLKKTEEGEVVGAYPTVSKNPKWYRDFYARNKKAPTNRDLKEIAIEQLSKGHIEDYGKIPANEIFTKLEAQLDNYEAILSDIKGGDYSFETPKNITKLDDKLKDLAKENKKLIKEYEAELTTLRAEKESKFKELYKEVEAREKVSVEEGIKKGVKKVFEGKKLKGLSEEEYKKGNKIIGQIHKAVHDKGLTGKQFTEIKTKYGHAGKLSGKVKRMSLEQLEAVLKAVNRARPKIVAHKHVITPKTEKKIQSLKENLIDKLQMSEEKYQEVLKDVGVYKEPKYIDGKHFITETQGKDIIYRLIDEANILRSTMPYDKAVEENPVVKKFIDKEKKIISRDRDRSMKDPREWNSMRVFAQKMEEITGVHVYRLYEDLIDTSLENKEKLGLFIKDFEPNKKILGDEKALKKVTAYVGSKSKLKGKPEYPKDITSEEIKLAKKVENMLIDYRARSRTQKFLDNVDHPEDMPQYEQYKKEMDKAKDIYESKGYDDLVEYMKTQEWGIIKNGYDPDQVWSPKIRLYKPAPQTFGKHNIKVHTSIEYREQDTNIIERLFTYKSSMDNLVEMRPKVKALITLLDQNLDKFQDPKKVQEVIEVFLRELKGYNKPEGFVERTLNRVYAQAMQTIIMPSLAMFGRNILQNAGFGYDKTNLIDPRNKKLDKGRMKFLNTYMTQMHAMKVDWFMVGEKPLPGLAWLTKMVNKVGIYPYSDQANRIWGFWAKINQIDRAFKGIDANSTERQLDKAMKGAKFGDIERTERIMALEILANDGYEAMARYVARCYVADTEFQYNRAERSPMEMGRGKWLTNLMLFPRSYWEMLLKQANHFKRGGIRQKARAFKVLASIVVGGLIVGEGYKKVTGRRENPYHPLRLLAYEPGGLAIGTVEAFYDVVGNTIMAINGDERAAGALATAIPRLSDMMIPFYDYTLRAIEATVPMSYRGEQVNKRIDVLALRHLRKLATDRMRELGWNVKGYKPNARGYHVERNFYQKLQYIIAGAGVDVGIKEEEKMRKAIPKSDVWEEVEEETKSDIWGTFDKPKKGKSSIWDTF